MASDTRHPQFRNDGEAVPTLQYPQDALRLPCELLQAPVTCTWSRHAVTACGRLACRRAAYSSLGAGLPIAGTNVVIG